MDLDALVRARQAEWDRLEVLSRKRRLTGAEIDELIERYQSAATDLSAVASAAGRTPVSEHLSMVLSRARLRFASARSNPLEAVARFFVAQLPAALYRIRWLCLAVAVAFIGVAVLSAVWASSTPELLRALGSQADIESYAKEEFVAYYSEHSEGAFTSLVWTNNAWIAAQCIAFGIIGVYPVYVLLSNAQGLGLSAAIMAEHDRLDVFFQYISPHGQLEMYAIFVAGAAGLMVFWSWIAPGARTRGQALAEEGRAMFAIVVGLVVALLVSGIIEGFVTRQDWPWPIKTGIGTLALAAFLTYQWWLGRIAYRAGQTGDLEDFDAGAKRLIAG